MNSDCPRLIAEMKISLKYSIVDTPQILHVLISAFSVGLPVTATGYTLLCVLRYHLSKVGKSARALLACYHRDARTLCFVQNSSIEIFFGRPSAWYKSQRLSKSFELYTICFILKTSPKVSFFQLMYKTSKLTVYKKVRYIVSLQRDRDYKDTPLLEDSSIVL